jgi:hypothetical protein
MSKIRTVTNVSIKENDELVSISESKYNALIEAATTAKTEPPEAMRKQTFTLHEAESLQDITELCPNEEVAVSLFNRGASLKQLKEISDLMESDDFEQVEGSYDLRDVIARVVERKKLSPMDKVLRSLGQLSDDEKQAIISKLLSAQAATA